MNLQLSDTIKRLRREKNMTQDDIADALQVSGQAVSRWENGLSYPDISLLPDLAMLLGVSMDTLFGVDAESETKKIGQYYEECDGVEDLDKLIKITKRCIAELPANAYLKFRLMELYIAKGFEFATGRLEEIRKLCRFVIDHAEEGWLRVAALNDMIAVEDDDQVDVWLSALDHKAVLTSAEVLINRYNYRDEIEKYNEAIQKEIVRSLSQLFARNFYKRDEKTYKNPRSRVEGQRIILKTIDVFRDPEIEMDAWLEERMFAYLRLAAGEFGSGNREEGYAALEKSVDLYIAYDELADGARLSYNCPALDMLSFVRDRSSYSECEVALSCLTNPDGWEWFNGVRHEERYQKQVERLKRQCEKGREICK